MLVLTHAIHFVLSVRYSVKYRLWLNFNYLRDTIMDCRLKFFQSGVLSGGSVSLKQQLAKFLSDCQLASKITLVLYGYLLRILIFTKMLIKIGLNNSIQYNYFHIILLKKQALYNPIKSTLSSYVCNILTLNSFSFQSLFSTSSLSSKHPFPNI